MTTKRIVSKIGDIYEVILPDGKKGYIQYIANDTTQLDSDVIRIFKERYPQDMKHGLTTILNGQVDFYCHVIGIDLGVRDGYWKKIGTSDDVGDLKEPFFRGSRDYGDSSIKVSKRWYVWHINEPTIYVGELRGENTKAEIGSAIPPAWVVRRMIEGRYHFLIPDYK